MSTSAADRMRRPRYVALTLLLTVTWMGPAGSRAWGDEAREKQHELNGGYYLLHKLSQDEAQLPLLLDIKHAPPDIKDLAVRISKTAEECSAQIEQMHDQDSHLRYDENPLPQIEQDIRESIQAEKQHQLLFGSVGTDFVRVLLLSQLEAMNYGQNIAKVLSSEESDARRVRKLNAISVKWLALHDECYHRLTKLD